MFKTKEIKENYYKEIKEKTKGVQEKWKQNGLSALPLQELEEKERPASPVPPPIASQKQKYILRKKIKNS